MLTWAAAAGAQSTDPGAASATFEGLVRPSRQVVLSAPMTAKVASVPVEESQRVEAGQVVAQMDDRLQQVVVESAKLKAQSDADVRRYRYAMDEAKIMLERAEQAFEADAASDWEVRRAALQHHQAVAMHDMAVEARALAQTQLKLEQEKLAQYRIEAPFAGHVVRVQVEPGAALSQGDPIALLVALDPLEAELYLPVELYGRLSVGEHYRLEAGEPVHRPLVARLKTVDPVIDPASQTFRCVFTIANEDSALPAGFTVRLTDLSPVPAETAAAAAMETVSRAEDMSQE